MIEVPVKDRTQFKCNASGTKLSQPEMLQDVVDFFVKETKEGKCYIWPAATQNHLDIYCEAKTEQGVDYLALEVKKEIENKYFNYDYDKDLTVIKRRLEAEKEEAERRKKERRRIH